MSTSIGYSVPSPFDIPAIQKQIDAALATLKPEEHGNVIVSVKPAGAMAALVIKGPKFGPFSSSAFAQVTKPLDGGKTDWSASGRISWLYGEGPEPKPPSWLAQFRGWARVLVNYNSLLVALWKAALLASGSDVKLIG